MLHCFSNPTLLLTPQCYGLVEGFSFETGVTGVSGTSVSYDYKILFDARNLLLSKQMAKNLQDFGSG
jgi:hypothetical protein